jgi:phage shock protein A
MQGAEWILEVVLVLLLGATLFHALRLERALGVLKRDRAVLEELVEGFKESTLQAETGIERLRSAADGAGRQMARQIETAQRLRDDLSFLADRSDKLAERLESAVRAARMVTDGSVLQGNFAAPPVQMPLPPQLPAAVPAPRPVPGSPHQPVALVAERNVEAEPRLRSQAERDLLRALRGVR